MRGTRTARAVVTAIAALAAMLAVVPPAGAADTDIVINELLASNDSVFPDDDGEFSDWIELHNTGAAAVDITGWHLTDDDANLTKWTFPSVSIPAGGFLVVFASSKNRTDPANPLHTNFSYSAGGEYAGLTAADGTTVIDEFAPEYPPQQTDITYGRASTGGIGFLAFPTPDAANAPEALADVVFSQGSGIFEMDFALDMSLAPGRPGTIRFTTDGTPPTDTSPAFTGPITVSSTQWVRARAFDGAESGSETQALFTEVDATVAAFSSDLPIVVVDTFGTGVSGVNIEAGISVIDTSGGSANPLDPAQFSGGTSIRIRGSSSSNFPKKQYKLELHDADGSDVESDLLGLGVEEDWVLYAPGRYDRNMISNNLMQSLAGDAGLLENGARFVEVYLNDDDTGPVTSADYDGIYVLLENIKIAETRVDVTKLGPDDNTPPEVTGGYILSIDRMDDDEYAFKTASGFPDLSNSWVNVVRPKTADMTPAQIAWIEGHVNAFETALDGPDFADPVVGYRAFIDVPSWIDAHLLRVLAMDVDALKLSNYFSLEREGLIRNEPLWDFDRSLESADSRDNEPQEFWAGSNGVDPYRWAWWGRLFEDPAFVLEYTARWNQLRSGPLADAAIFAEIDSLAGAIANAYPREDARWGSTSGYGSRFGDLDGEITHLKDWLTVRLGFLDETLNEMVKVDLAEDGTASQSSTSGSATADRANDGDPNGDGVAETYSATDNESEPYWEVDLGSVADIDNIRLWDRANGPTGLLDDVHIFVSDTPFTSSTISGVQAQPGVLDLFVPGDVDRSESFAIGRTGRYVRIQLEGTTQLFLAEVEVFAPLDNDPPTVDPIPGQTSVVGADVSVTATADDPDGDDVVFSAAGLPPEVDIDPDSGEISGRFDDPGVFNVVVTATDPFGASGSTPFTWTVDFASPAPLILNEWNAVDSANLIPDGDSFFGSVVGNGGDWFELVVTEDHLDIRGWSLELSDTDNVDDVLEVTDTFVFAADPLLANLRSGTIITVAESVVDDPSYDPLGGDWWINLQSESGDGGQFFTPGSQSNFDTNNQNWRLRILDDAGAVVMSPTGEGVAGVSGVGSSEVGELDVDPSPSITPASGYDDSDGSTFGSANELDAGFQDFSVLRSVVGPDVTEPDTTISTPPNRSDVPSGLVSIGGTATDDSSGVAEVLVSVRDRENGLWLQDDGSFSSGFARLSASLVAPGATSTDWSLDVTLPDGSWSVITRGIDVAGNTELIRGFGRFTTSGGVTDVVEPDTDVDTPGHNEVVAPGVVSITGTATDDASGVDRVRVTVRNRITLEWLQADGVTFDPAFALIEAVVASPGSLATTWSLDVTVPSGGSWAITTRAIDVDGNVESSRPWVPFSTS